MIRIGILGDIGSGKTYIAQNFGYPVFDADKEVGLLYQNDRKIFNKLKKAIPNYVSSFPIKKQEISKAILANNNNLNKIIKIVHFEIRKKMKSFLKKNKNKKIVILDIPLLIENKLYKKNDVFVFVQSKKNEVFKRLKKRKNFNKQLYEKFKKNQVSKNFKKKISNFIIKNDFKKNSVKKEIIKILNKIL